MCHVVFHNLQGKGADLIQGKVDVAPVPLEIQFQDAVIVATGSITSMPPIKGLEHSVCALDAINHPEQLGDRIVIAGGGLVGCEIAYDEVQKGKNVTVVEALDKIMAAGAAAPLPNLMMQAEFAARNVNLMINTRVTEITESGVVVTGADGSQCTVEADTVINALGFRPVNTLAEELKADGIAVCTVGDANQPANILKAVAEGYAAANNI